MSENTNVGKVFNLTGGAGSATIPVASDTAPQMDGTASAGSSQAWSRADHVHPTDTSRAAASHTHSKTDITDFPSTMDPTAHTHTKSEITDFTHTHTKSEITDFPSTMPPSLHTHSAGDITSGTLGSARLPTVPLTKGGTGQTTAAKGLYALINGATAITATNVADSDYIGLYDVSAVTGKKMLISELKELVGGSGGGELVYTELTESGTWTAPNNIVNNEITVLCCGGGGSGGFGSTSSSSGGFGGGGGSGYITIKKLTVTPGNTYYCIIGAGGTNPGTDSSYTNGNAGGTTTFGNNLVSANGGEGGYGNGNGGSGNAGGGGGSSNSSSTGCNGGNGSTYGGGGGAGSEYYGQGGNGGKYGGGGGSYSYSTAGSGGTHGGHGGGYGSSQAAENGLPFEDGIVQFLTKLFCIEINNNNFNSKAAENESMKYSNYYSGGGGYGGAGGLGQTGAGGGGGYCGIGGQGGGSYSYNGGIYRTYGGGGGGGFFGRGGGCQGWVGMLGGGGGGGFFGEGGKGTGKELETTSGTSSATAGERGGGGGGGGRGSYAGNGGDGVIAIWYYKEA